MSVDAWEDQIQIDTYVLGPANPYPPLQRTGMGIVYPYPLLDDMPGPRSPVSYGALHVENEYLHAIVLPDLGGRLYSLYDKLAGREVFYRNNVIKYGFVARRGAWISGGIEFNFPQGHTCATVSPVSARIIADDEDGAARIAVGCRDRVSRMRWCVELGLAPGDARLHQRVVLHNPTPYRQRHYFWSNSAVPATDDLRLVFPATRVRTSHGDHDYPLLDGRDLSLYRNHEVPNDIFCLNSAEDFFGCYYEDSDHGLVHWSDHRVHFGKKFFTWGTADEGMIWVDLLTDDDGQYVELQSGRFVDQATFDFLGAHQTVEWDECWYPVAGIGGYQYANMDAAVNCSVVDGEFRITGVATSEVGPAQIMIVGNGHPPHILDVDLMPGVPFSVSMPADSVQAGSGISIVGEGHSLLAFTYGGVNTAMRPIELAAQPRDVSGKPETADDLVNAGLNAELRNDQATARDRYRQALSSDEDHVRAHLGIGRLLLRQGLAADARIHLLAAVRRDHQNDEAWFNLALAEIATGEEECADQILWWLADRAPYAVPARIELAMRALRLADPAEALELAARSTPSIDGLFLMAVACRHLGLENEHQSVIRIGTERLPLSPEMTAEAFLAVLDTGDMGAISEPAQLLLATLRDDPHEWVELATQYDRCGDVDAAIAVLKLGVAIFETVASDPMAVCHLAALIGDQDAEGRWAAALSTPADFCFPSTPEDRWAIEDGLAWQPDSQPLHLYYGNLMASLDHHDEAMSAWETAARLGPDDSVVYRNLGLGSSIWRDDQQTALEWYERAVKAAPTQYRLYLERDDVLKRAAAAPRVRLKHLRSGPQSVVARWEIAGRMVDCLLELERWDAAIALLRDNTFLPWEGARGVHAQWVSAHVGRAGQRLERGDVSRALDDYRAALTYPRNLGVGRAAYPEQARVHWLLAEAALKAGDEDTRVAHLTAGADERHRHPCEADIHKARCLRALGREAEADDVLQRLSEWVTKRLDTQPDDAQAVAIRRALEEAPGE